MGISTRILVEYLKNGVVCGRVQELGFSDFFFYIFRQKLTIIIPILTIILTTSLYGFYQAKSSLKNIADGKPSLTLITKEGESYPALKAYPSLTIVHTDEGIAVIDKGRFEALMINSSRIISE